MRIYGHVLLDERKKKKQKTYYAEVIWKEKFVLNEHCHPSGCLFMPKLMGELLKHYFSIQYNESCLMIMQLSPSRYTEMLYWFTAWNQCTVMDSLLLQWSWSFTRSQNSISDLQPASFPVCRKYACSQKMSVLNKNPLGAFLLAVIFYILLLFHKWDKLSMFENRTAAWTSKLVCIKAMQSAYIWIFKEWFKTIFHCIFTNTGALST